MRPVPRYSLQFLSESYCSLDYLIVYCDKNTPPLAYLTLHLEACVREDHVYVIEAQILMKLGQFEGSTYKLKKPQ